jgi:hypothetical protein
VVKNYGPEPDKTKTVLVRTDLQRCGGGGGEHP